MERVFVNKTSRLKAFESKTPKKIIVPRREEETRRKRNYSTFQ
jgi:hypothetical protein